MSDSPGIIAAKSTSRSDLIATASAPPPNAWFKWLEEWRVGDHLGILGLLLTVVGMWMTYREARRSRTASEAAKRAAEETRNVRQLIDISLELNSVREHLIELKTTVLSNDWSSIASRIDNLCQLLGNTRLEMVYGTNPHFTDEDQETVSEAISLLRKLEPLIAKKGAVPPDQPKGLSKLHNQVVAPLSAVIDDVDSLRFKAKSLSVSREWNQQK
jgi:hypothetical protein